MAGDHPVWEHVCKAADEDLVGINGAIRVLACTSDTVVTGSARPVVKVWKVTEAKIVEAQRLRHGAVGSSCIEVANDGNLVMVCTDDGGIGFWDLREQKRAGELAFSIPTVWKAKFLPDGQRLVSGGPSGSLCFWDLRTSRLESEIAPDGLASGPKDDGLPPAKRQKGDAALPGQLPGEGGAKTASPVHSLAVSGDGKLLGCGRGTGDISIMRVTGHEWVGDILAHQGETLAPVRALAFDSASRLLLSGGDDNHVCCLNAAAWAKHRSHLDTTVRSPQLERFSAHRAWVTSVSTCPDPVRRVLVTTSADATVKLWDYGTQELLCNYKDHVNGVCASAFAPVDGRFFVTAGADALLALYTLKDKATA